MDYVIDREHLRELAVKEVSNVADRAYTEEGQSLYDGIVIHSSELVEIDNFIGQAISSLVSRLQDISRHLSNRDSEKIIFDVPGFEDSKENLVRDEIENYITDYSCALWFQKTYSTKAEEYTKKAIAASDKAVNMLKAISLKEDFVW